MPSVPAKVSGIVPALGGVTDPRGIQGRREGWEFAGGHGHGEPCCFCGRLTDNLSGDPADWAMHQPPERGDTRWMHTGCWFEMTIVKAVGSE